MRELKTLCLFALGVALLFSLGFGYLLPVDPPSYKGGKVSITCSPTGGSETWENNSKDAIFDCFIIAYDGNDEEIDPSNVNISVNVDDVVKDWDEINGYNQTNSKKMVTETSSESCQINQKITISTTSNVARLDIWFTNDQGSTIHESAQISSGTAIEILDLPFQDAAMNDIWSLTIKNNSNYLICGFTFSETPTALSMSNIYSHRVGTTDTTLKKVNFEYPLAPMTGHAVVGAKYSSAPVQATTVWCAPIFSKAIPESANSRQVFSSGENISVPNITITEAEAGVINTTAAKTKIILIPRGRFEFQSIGNLMVTSGNIQLGTASVVNGQIQIEIVTPSYGTGKSVIRISGIEIKTLTGLTDGAISVKQEEPQGNNSNFHYAYFQQEEE